MTIKLVKAIRVKPLPGYRLELVFSDGSNGIADLSDVARSQGEMALPLADETYFARVFLEMGTPTWPNGYDADPSNLRMRIEAAGALSADATA